MFDIHKMKPIHGWREFLGEVGIIVLGVLIALTAEQVMERIRWRAEVGETVDTLNASLAASREQAIERIYVNSCLRKEVAQVAAFVSNGAGRTPIRVHGAPLRPWEESSWSTAMASGVMTHMPLDLRLKYASLYDAVAILKKSNEEEFAVWSDLASLNLNPVVTAAARDRLESDLARAKALNRLIVLASRQFNQQSKALNIHLRPKDRADLEDDLRLRCPY